MSVHRCLSEHTLVSEGRCEEGKRGQRKRKWVGNFGKGNICLSFNCSWVGGRPEPMMCCQDEVRFFILNPWLALQEESHVLLL